MIVPLIANVGLTPAESFNWSWLGWLIGGLACLAVCINQIDDFLDRRKTKPGEPPNEQLQESHRELTRRVEGVEHDIQSLRVQISDNYQLNQEHASARSKTIFDAIAETRKELRGEIQGVRDSVADMQTNMPNQLVALLRNTGAIRR